MHPIEKRRMIFVKGVLFRIIRDDTLLLVLGIIFIHRCITGKKLIKKMDTQGDHILKVVVFIVAIFMLVNFVIPTVLDIPYCIKGDFLIIEGIAQHNADRNGLDREVEVLDEENQKIIRVVFPYKPGIKKGDKIRVQYVPHSGYGRLLEINGEKYRK